jgi:RND superfamily putative drug exporter
VGGVSVLVGGASASLLDDERRVATGLWKVILAVLCLAFVVLMVFLKSLLLPLKAIVMNLLSVGAAYGVLVIVFQWGWFDSIFNYHSPGHVDTLTPPLILAVVFGLSMDYEVFLLTRIRERWLLTGDSRKAVAEGLAESAKTISSAAFILVCVFAVFIGTGMPSVKEIGLGAAVAIAMDATLIRLVLVPATMELVGDWNWWLPDPLRRLLSPRATALPPQASTELSVERS